jgi:hypothetical protein
MWQTTRVDISSGAFNVLLKWDLGMEIFGNVLVWKCINDGSRILWYPMRFFGFFSSVTSLRYRQLILGMFWDFGVNSYGDMPAHNLLLADCEKTSGDVMARLAIIPMMQVHTSYPCLPET